MCVCVFFCVCFFSFFATLSLFGCVFVPLLSVCVYVHCFVCVGSFLFGEVRFLLVVFLLCVA